MEVNVPVIPSCAGWSLCTGTESLTFFFDARALPLVDSGHARPRSGPSGSSRRLRMGDRGHWSSCLGQPDDWPVISAPVVVIDVVALPTVVFLWAIAIREREPTPLDLELYRLAPSRREKINGMSERLRSMEWADSRDHTRDTAKVRRTASSARLADSPRSEADEFDRQGASVYSNSSRASAGLRRW